MKTTVLKNLYLILFLQVSGGRGKKKRTVGTKGESIDRWIAGAECVRAATGILEIVCDPHTAQPQWSRLLNAFYVSEFDLASMRSQQL